MPLKRMLDNMKFSFSNKIFLLIFFFGFLNFFLIKKKIKKLNYFLEKRKKREKIKSHEHLINFKLSKEVNNSFIKYDSDFEINSELNINFDNSICKLKNTQLDKPFNKIKCDLMEEIDYFKLKNVEIIISKKDFQLKIFSDKKLIKSCLISYGSNKDKKDKIFSSDKRTPEGIFRILSCEKKCTKDIQNKSDFRIGLIDSADIGGEDFFVHFYRFDSQKWVNFGIKGTYDETTLGKLYSNGNILIHEKDLIEISSILKIGTKILIENISK